MQSKNIKVPQTLDITKVESKNNKHSIMITMRLIEEEVEDRAHLITPTVQNSTTMKTMTIIMLNMMTFLMVSCNF
jgi:hypothetical protein